jgi:predicted P-loop ATPase
MIVSRSVGAVAREITVHPVRDHVGALAWDGVPRIETWVCRYLGAEDTAFNRSVGALWLISAVARIFRPGVTLRPTTCWCSRGRRARGSLPL